MPLNRTEAATQAGLSERQKVTGCDPRGRGSADELIREKRRAEWPFCELCYNSHPVVILGPPLIGGRPAHWIGSSAASSSEFMNRFIGQHALEHPGFQPAQICVGSSPSTRGSTLRRFGSFKRK